MNSKEILSLQARSIAVYCFLDKYNILEEMILDNFKRNIVLSPPEVLNKVYFYSGSKVSSYINPEKLSIEANPIYFDLKKEFQNFTLNEVLKIDKNTSIIPILNKRITLKQKKVEMEIRDCVRCFLGMRNRLAHRMHNVSFKNGDYVEILSGDKILESGIEYDFSNYEDVMDDITQQVLSNLVYMIQIQKLIK